VSASNTAFDTVSKVSRQTADWAQANFAAAAKAATAAATVAGSAATARAA
jgi:hypothetical protein